LFLQPQYAIFQVRHIVLQALDMMYMKPFMFRLIEGDLTHELAQVVQSSLNAPKTLVVWSSRALKSPRNAPMPSRISRRISMVGSVVIACRTFRSRFSRNNAGFARLIFSYALPIHRRQARKRRGVTGQDGAYLAELLLGKCCEVHGIKRRTSLFNTDRIDHLSQDAHEPDRRFVLRHGDMTDSSSFIRIIQQAQPDEIYNLAAQSPVAVSFEEPEYTADSDGLGTLRLLEAIRILGLERKTRFYSGLHLRALRQGPGDPAAGEFPLLPPLRPPYAVAKLYAYWITVNYREAYGIYACNGILFNHESPIRGETFVIRKITRALARIKLGLQERLYLGNLDAKRDWGHARDYVRMRRLMLQQDHA
jgi:GDP-mannose 4,6-dehydratase